MTDILINEIYFKRGTKKDLIDELRADKQGIPGAGEPIYEIDTGKLKIGDGVHAYYELDYATDGLADFSVIGYKLNDKFYKDSTYTKEVDKETHSIYIDMNGSGSYRYQGDTFIKATEFAQLVKLYNTHGENEDGTMTQKAITNGVNTIQFAIKAGDQECLVLNPAWTNE